MLELVRRLLANFRSKVAISPPMQNGEPLHQYPAPIPYFRFGLGSLVDEQPFRKIKVCIAYPNLATERYPELMEVDDSYTVQVPEFDGDRAIAVSLETRSRRCHIAVQTDSEVKPRKFSELFYYVIGVPYTRYDENGELKNKHRIEIRNRKSFPNEIPVEFIPRIVSTTYELNSLDCFAPNGQRLTSNQVAGKLRRETPVMIVNDLEFVTPYFSSLLKSQCVVIVENGSGVNVEDREITI